MKTYDLGWGESVAVRKAFLAVQKTGVYFEKNDLANFNYPDHAGDKELLELTQKIIKRNTGNHYDYILMTNGATGAVTIAMRSFNKEYKICFTLKPPYFSLYPSMIEAAGLTHACPEPINPDRLHQHQDGVYLVDSLSNPLGRFRDVKRNIYGSPIIWDAVYFGNVYAPGEHPKPDHDVLIGSYSKLTGLNGLRVGWIATNNGIYYRKMAELVTAEYCGIGVASTEIIKKTAGTMSGDDWTRFEMIAQNSLNDNRTEFSKLEKFFGETPVSPYGMFYYAPLDEQCRKLLEKSGIVWSLGSQLGTSDDFGRFNVGQDTSLIREAVRVVLKNDKL